MNDSFVIGYVTSNDAWTESRVAARRCRALMVGLGLACKILGAARLSAHGHDRDPMSECESVCSGCLVHLVSSVAI